MYAKKTYEKVSTAVIIRNNEHCYRIYKARTVLKFFYNLVNAYKKFINILNTFLLLIEELLIKTFTVNNNNENIITLLDNRIISLHNDILMIFTASLYDIQLHNISTTTTTCPGYKIYTMEEICDIKSNIYYFINSFRIQLYEGLIKLVFNDSNNLPESILFIGYNVNKNLNCEDILNKCKSNTLLAIDKIKIIQMKYIQINNSIQNIINNLCL